MCGAENCNLIAGQRRDLNRTQGTHGSGSQLLQVFGFDGATIEQLLPGLLGTAGSQQVEGYLVGFGDVQVLQDDGSRLLAESDDARQALLASLLELCQANDIPSLHILFASPLDLQACEHAGLLQRGQVQFHWQNQGWRDFDDFLSSLTQEKRKKIRQERRKVQEAGVTFRAVRGPDMSEADWALLLRCYQQTYWEHGNAPYLTPAFFEAMRTDMAQHWLLFVAERAGLPMGISLIGLHLGAQGQVEVAYGRYWGALARVDCLHFEACYYQPIEWCITQGVQRFEGGAQGEHKMARALLPTPTHSAHWLANPSFSEAVARFLEREKAGVDNYLDALHQHSPLKKPP